MNNEQLAMMEGWKTDKIENIFFLGRGRVINDEEIKDHPGNYPVYSSQTSNNGEFGKVDFYEFEGECITWTTDGANAGKVFYRSGKFNCTNVCGTLKPKNPQETNVKFFAYLIDRHAFRHVAVVGNNKLMNNVMGKIKITFPADVNQQTAIAAILSKVDEAIAAVQASIAAAERLKKSLMQNLLTGRMKPDGTLRKEDEFYVDEKFGRVPLGWEVKKVKDFGEVITGKTPPTEKPDVFSDKEHGIMFVTPGDVDTAKYIEQTERYVSEKGIKFSYTLPQNAVCEICIGSTIGKIGITTKECCTNQQITSVVMNEENDAEYFYYAMLARKDHFKSVAGINATPQINKSEYSKYRVLCPKSKDDQIAIAQELSAIDTEINKKQNKIAVLERLKKSLMQNLLTGKVRVNNKI